MSRFSHAPHGHLQGICAPRKDDFFALRATAFLAPSERGLSAKPTGGEKVRIVSLPPSWPKAMTPPSQREALGRTFVGADSSAPPETLDNAGRMGIIKVRGRCDKRSALSNENYLSKLRNRHLAEWRFLLFSFMIRIETEYRPT